MNHVIMVEEIKTVWRKTTLQSKKPNLMLIDGMAVLFRAYYATAVTGQFMYNSKGVPTNGLFGFIKHFMEAISTFKPSHVAVCWDMGSKTFRNELYSEYKANRSEPPEELIPQFDLAKDVVSAFSVPNIGMVGFEADDCIGTIVEQKRGKANIHILTGDHDILQLLGNNTSVVLFKRGFGNYDVQTETSFFADKGISPKQMIDVKAFMGDSSDNYPGVKGIGEKTALKLIKQYEHVDGVLANLDKLTKAQKSKIETDMEMLHLSRQLAEIKVDVPLKFSIDEAVFQFDRDQAMNKLAEIEVRGLDRLLPADQQMSFL